MTRRFKLALVCTLLVVTSAGGESQISGRKSIWEPLQLLKPTAEIPKGSVRGNILTHLRVSGVNVELEETELTKVKAQLGGEIGTRGDAADSLAWLCYEVPTDSGRTVLWLMSGEMDDGTVGGFQWINIAASTQVDKRCRLLPKGSVELPIAVRPGMTEEALKKVLGKPTLAHHSDIEYVHEEEQQIRNAPYFEMNTVYVLLRNGITRGIEVWKSTTT
jgi:hypothetical protein